MQKYIRPPAGGLHYLKIMKNKTIIECAPDGTMAECKIGGIESSFGFQGIMFWWKNFPILSGIKRWKHDSQNGPMIEFKYGN